MFRQQAFVRQDQFQLFVKSALKSWQHRMHFWHPGELGLLLHHQRGLYLTDQAETQ